MEGILIIVVLVVIAGLVYIGMRDDRSRDPLQERLAQFGERELPDSLEEIELSLPFRDRVLIPVLRSLLTLRHVLRRKSSLRKLAIKLKLRVWLARLSRRPSSLCALARRLVSG
jgi:hypothetical protein